MRTINVVRVAAATKAEAEAILYTLRERWDGGWTVEERRGGPEAEPTGWPMVFRSVEEIRAVISRSACP